MDEVLKHRILVSLAILSTLLLFGNLSSCNSARRHKLLRDKEMAARLLMEEQSTKFVQERSLLEERAKAKENEVAELKTALEASQKALTQSQLINQSLKDELQKVTKLKESQEEQLKQALSDGKKFKK
jgi:septal ring factor EnvC (AmiA/AmiB activator)